MCHQVRMKVFFTGAELRHGKIGRQIRGGYCGSETGGAHGSHIPGRDYHRRVEARVKKGVKNCCLDVSGS